ncbi:MAG: reductoisomerase C-terminal domain, partial [Actinomycetota bacterium]|nr:reductoisomerase C-terminal domain [Actinomycetota bacterium]
AFLDGRLAYLGIPDVVERVLDAHEPIAPSLEGVLEVDAWARERASATIAARRPSRRRINPASGATR